MDKRTQARSLGARVESRPGWRVGIAVLVLAALAGLIWLAISLANGSKTAGPGGPGAPGAFGGFGGARGARRPSTTVGVATATTADVPITLDALGTVTPAATVTVTPQVSGVITEILFKEGQTVKKGQALVVIDPRPLQMALLQAQGNQTRDEAQLANAKVLLERDRTLLAQDSIARQDVDTQAALVKQLEGTVMTDKAAVGTAKLNLGYSRVIAPVSGRIGLRAVDLGNFIQAGSTTGLAVLTEVTPIDVQFTIPQDQVPQVQAQAAQGRLPVTAFDRTKTTVLDQGVFSTLDNQVDPTTGTVKAKARFPNTKGTLFPSQFVNVRIALQTLHNVVVVPVTAVRTGPDGDFVWILRPDKTVTKRKVTRGPGTPTSTSLTQGLNVGERVITEGGDRLTEGAKVTLPGDSNMMMACAADMKKLCDGKQGRDALMCLRQNQAKASAPCRTAMTAAAAARSSGGGSAGGYGGGSGGAGRLRRRRPDWRGGRRLRALSRDAGGARNHAQGLRPGHEEALPGPGGPRGLHVPARKHRQGERRLQGRHGQDAAGRRPTVLGRRRSPCRGGGPDPGRRPGRARRGWRWRRRLHAVAGIPGGARGHAQGLRAGHEEALPRPGGPRSLHVPAREHRQGQRRLQGRHGQDAPPAAAGGRLRLESGLDLSG